jgi:hypothetical protein
MEDMDCNGGGCSIIKGGESYLYANYIITLPSIKLINNRYVARESSCPVTAIEGESTASVSAHADTVVADVGHRVRRNKSQEFGGLYSLFDTMTSNVSHCCC